MRIASLKYNLLLHLKNMPGPKVGKKIVVIEADDYGGIRIPSAEVYSKLKNAGVDIDASRYNLLDTLEDTADLEALFETLHSVKDHTGHAAIMTPFVNVANPDFDKIKADNFQTYFYEPFTTTYQKYGRDAAMMAIWKQGMTAGIFTPELHGKEHISVQPWLQQLQKGNTQLLTAFNEGFVAVNNIEGVHAYAQEFRPEFYCTNNNQKDFLHTSIQQGVQLFKNIFGYLPTSFTPSNSHFHPDFEQTVYNAGVKFLSVGHNNPYSTDTGELAFKKYTFKQGIKSNALNFYIRNCAFEPNDPAYKNIDITMQQVAAAFSNKKPAIISTHRVNFGGVINTKNRDKGLKELQYLLQHIVKRWPDVVFMSNSNMVKELKN
jgi:hypothetical protein